MTSFAYNNGVPNAPNNPSNDQPLMLINTQSINSIIGVDHVSFEAANGGTHEQVQFNANNVPSTTPPLPTLFTNDVNNVRQLFFYTGAPAQAADQYYQSATESSTMLMGSLILKCGKIPSGGTAGTVMFTKSFPNNLYSVVLTADTSTLSPKSASISHASTFDKTTFTWILASPSVIYWIAIGN